MKTISKICKVPKSKRYISHRRKVKNDKIGPGGTHPVTSQSLVEGLRIIQVALHEPSHSGYRFHAYFGTTYLISFQPAYDEKTRADFYSCRVDAVRVANIRSSSEELP